jgi:hypothetical protein
MHTRGISDSLALLWMGNVNGRFVEGEAGRR